MTKRRASSAQPDLFAPPPPMIRGETNIPGRDVWYDRRTCTWTTDPSELLMDAAALRAHRAKQVADFDAAMEAWK
jgi:hypothetical protein